VRWKKAHSIGALWRWWGSRFLVLFGGAVFLWCPITQGKTRIPVPPWMDAVLVSEEMVINGLPSIVYHFEVEQSKEEVLQFYRTAWQDIPDGVKIGFREVETDNWTVISRVEDSRYLLTVQVRATGSFTSNGYLAEGDLKNMTSDLSEGIPSLRNSQVVNRTTSNDPGQTGVTALVVNEQSIASNSSFYRQYYTERNWSQLMDIAQQGGQVLAYRKGGTEVHLVITEGYQKTQVVFNQVEHH